MVRLVSAIMSHRNKDALMADLQSEHPYTPLSGESKQMIHTQGNVKGFELCQISRTIQVRKLMFGWTEESSLCKQSLPHGRKGRDARKYGR